MGNSNDKEALFEAINSDDVVETEKLLKANPTWINERITDDCGSTPLGLATWRGNIEMIYTLLNLGADVNTPGSQKLSPLQIAARRGKDEALDFLVQKGADINFISEENMTALDYAILYANYNVARKLMLLGIKPKTPEHYHELQKIKNPIYYDFALMLDCMNKGVPLEECPQFNVPPPEKEFRDPVIDPRESWGGFFKRVMEFEDPPLVERSELPPDLQPQNRFFGKVRAVLNGQPIYGEPGVESSEEMKQLTPRSRQKLEEMKSDQMDINDQISVQIHNRQEKIAQTIEHEKTSDSTVSTKALIPETVEVKQNPNQS